MSPTIVTQAGRPMLAIGGTGGRLISNSLADVLTQFVVLGNPLAKAVGAPRMHTEGGTAVSFEPSWPAAETEELSRLGYTVNPRGRGAKIGAVAREHDTLQRARR
jgi:gamma-glutamyltranspeptidase/glutathione hydrolase